MAGLLLARLLLSIVLTTVIFCNFGKADSHITDDDWETRRCANLNPYVDENTIILITERNSKWNQDQFCHAFRKNMKVSGAYKMSVDFQLGGGIADYPGFIFNKWDDCNYDWIYKQLTGKFIFGRVQNCGSITYGSPNTFATETITPKTIWYNLRIEVANNKNVKVFLNNVLKGSFSAYFNTRGFGGVAIANGYSTTCQFRDFEIEPMN